MMYQLISNWSRYLGISPRICSLVFCLYCLVFSQVSSSQDLQTSADTKVVNEATSKIEAEDVAKKLRNPITDMASVSFEWGWDQKIAPNNGHSQTLEISPLIPITLPNNDVFVLRPNVTGALLSNVGEFSGYGVQNIEIESFYTFIANKNTMWGIGPYVNAPAGASGKFGSQQTGVGVNAAIQSQDGPWIYGILVRRYWNAGGVATSGTQNNAYFNPYVSYVTANAWSFNYFLEPEYNFDKHQTQDPMTFSISKVIMTSGIPIEYELGEFYYATNVPGTPQGWGARFTVTFAMPNGF